MSGDSFVFNCYCHHSELILRNGDVTANIIHSKEVVIQKDPLDMVAYGTEVLLMIKC